MMKEVEVMKSKSKEKEISFEEFVKLYVNHRPVMVIFEAATFMVGITFSAISNPGHRQSRNGGSLRNTWCTAIDRFAEN